MAVATPPNPLIACQTHGRTKPSPCLNAPRACQRQSCVRRAVAQPNGLTTQAPASSGLPEQQQQVGSRKKRSRRREQAKQNGRTAAPSPTCLWENAYHGYLQKLTPACKNDRQNLQELRAAMRIALKTGGKPDAVSMCLRKLSLLGCYDQPLYSMLTAMLSRALVVWPRMCTPRHVSLALFSCALSRAFDAHVDSVAAWVGRHQEQHLQGWKAQHLSNALFAWAVLSATARGDTPAMRACAQSLFAAANSRGSAGFAVPNDLGKLHWAHLEAQHVGLRGGGLVDVGLQQAAQAEAARVQRSVSEELGGMMQEVAVVLESLGFGVVTMHEEVHMGSGHSEGMVGVCGVKGMEEHGGIRVGLGHGGGPKEEVGRNSAGRGQGISWEGSGRDETGMEWDGTKGCRACEGESKTDSGGISFCIGLCTPPCPVAQG
ncbi:hypothetical protein DUNSADRAFT_17526 [Dunaliella salina]|uniref:Uncharacterized protein n=1 Tax=Dunaliella salina TaxID=3046 RepID=A0ABQ7GZZ4_DUNSA|nr:hypothetical protein DUNSADRAFT_17526 [Dunaliella salina]|eukprot:KAF5840179.1 hypothetical protein DUNSADRAFT_17526 [Dunaliella salina]